jgi:hypothetical protein
MTVQNRSPYRERFFVKEKIVKYCFEYTNKLARARLQEADEIRIWYDNQATDLIDFIKEFATKRIILCVPDVDRFIQQKGWSALALIAREAPDIKLAVCFDNYRHARAVLQEFGEEKKEALVQLRKIGIDYFYACYASNWDELHAFLAIGVSDVYIAEALGFELDAVAKLCHPEVNIRIYANVAQSCVEAPALMKFFVRPDDVEMLEPYIDILEMWGPTDRQAVYADIYRQGYWHGDLNEIIIGLHEPINNDTLLPTFGEMRLKCGRKCLKGHHCDICSRTVSIANKMQQANLIIRKGAARN